MNTVWDFIPVKTIWDFIPVSPKLYNDGKKAYRQEINKGESERKREIKKNIFTSSFFISSPYLQKSPSNAMPATL